MRTLPHVLCATAAIAVVPAQIPLLNMTPASQISFLGAAASYDFSVLGGAPYALFLDLAGGPVNLLDERFYLGLSPSLATLTAGVVPVSSLVVGAYSVPLIPGLAGLTLYGQVVMLDPSAQNGLFRVSNGSSTSFWNATNAIVAGFDAASIGSYTGTFAADLIGKVRGGAVTRRTHSTVDPLGLPFGQGIRGPLNPFGSRVQMVFRTQDVGAIGQPELLTRVGWKPHPSQNVQADTFSHFELRAAHSEVVPIYTLDPWSALPIAPLSGLSLHYANNPTAGATQQTMYQGAYVIDPAQLLASGYMPYPIVSPFRYDGVSSLLLEYRVNPSAANGLNGSQVNLMVQSAAEPFARVTANGTNTALVVPAVTPNAQSGDNAMHDLELEFARIETHCQSPWLDAGAAAPDYQAPIVARSVPAGCSVQTLFRGSASPAGLLPTAWSSSPDIADGRRYLQFQIVFLADHLSGERPIVDTLIVPVQ